MELITLPNRMWEIPQEVKGTCTHIHIHKRGILIFSAENDSILSSPLLLFQKKLIIQYEPRVWAGFACCVLQCGQRARMRNTVFGAMPRRGSISFHTLPSLFRRGKFQESMSALGFFFPPSQEVSSPLPDWNKRMIEFLLYTFQWSRTARIRSV